MPKRRRKKKDKWKAKEWYNILSSQLFDKRKIAETLANDPEKIVGRTIETSYQDFTDDISKSHLKLIFKISEVKGLDAHTKFIGHSMTTDYLRRMTRKNRSKIDGVYDIKTRDESILRIKPSAMTNRRIQSSLKSAIRKAMGDAISKTSENNFEDLVKEMLDGKLGWRLYKACQSIYPVKRVEICKSEVIIPPKIEVGKEEAEETKEKKETKSEDKENEK